MICGNAFLKTYRAGFALVGATLLSLALGTTAVAQNQNPSPFENLTVENLIGEAVSLSNQDYPEVEKAIQRFRNNDSAGALEFLKNAKKKYPKLPPSQVIFARMNLVLRNAQASRVAIFWLEQAVTEIPDDPEAYLILADQAFGAGRTAEAEALFEFAAPIVEKFDANTKRKEKFRIRILAGRAAVAQRRAQWEVAHKWLQKWVESDPDSAVAHQRLGGALFNLDKPRKALEEFNKARELDTKDIIAHPYVSLGQLFSRAGDAAKTEEERKKLKEKARKAFQHAYDGNKLDEKVSRAFIDWLISQDELEQAQTIVKTLREQDSTSASALMLDGILDVMQGKRAEAIDTMTEILGIDPSNSRATDLLALLLIESDNDADKKKALQYAQVNAQRFPENSQVNVTQGWVLYQLGKKNEAQQFLSRVKQNTLTPDAYYLLAKMMVESNKEEQATKALEAIINNKKPALFIFRRDAEKLLAELKAG